MFISSCRWSTRRFIVSSRLLISSLNRIISPCRSSTRRLDRQIAVLLFNSTSRSSNRRVALQLVASFVKSPCRSSTGRLDRQIAMLHFNSSSRSSNRRVALQLVVSFVKSPRGSSTRRIKEEEVCFKQFLFLS